MEALVDTGFTSSLTLPLASATALGLVYRSAVRGMLADGTECAYDVYEAEVFWEGAHRPILVSAVGSQALLGMRMLRGHEVWMEVNPGGAVEIRELP